MTKPNPLDYANPLHDRSRPFSWLAIFALVLGLCLGPIWWVVAYLPMIFTGFAALEVGKCVALVCGVISSVFCGYAFFRLGNPASPRGRMLAMFGLIAAIIWTIVIVGYLSTLRIT
jgi:hypothetical protein